MMAHFAEINDSNEVLQVCVVADTDCEDGNGDESESVGITFLKALLGNDTNWVQTSYNARIRKNFAGIGYTWDSGRNAFIPPKPFNSWQLDEDTCTWKSPVARPTDGENYVWDEANTQWVAE